MKWYEKLGNDISEWWERLRDKWHQRRKPQPSKRTPTVNTDGPPLVSIPNGALDYNAVSWWENARRDMYGMLRTSPFMPEAICRRIDVRRSGTTWVPLVGYNEGDGAHPIPLYADHFGGRLNESVAAHIADVVLDHLNLGYHIDLWFEVDDSPKANRAPMRQKLANIDKQLTLPVGSRIMAQVVSMVTIGLEMGERREDTYRSTDHQAEAVAYAQKRLKELVPDRFIPVMVHYNRTDSDRALRTGADGIHAQESKTLTIGQLRARLRPHVAAMHREEKLLIAFEYGHNNNTAADKDKGTACLEMKCDGTGSGRH